MSNIPNIAEYFKECIVPTLAFKDNNVMCNVISKQMHQNNRFRYARLRLSFEIGQRFDTVHHLIGLWQLCDVIAICNVIAELEPSISFHISKSCKAYN